MRRLALLLTVLAVPAAAQEAAAPERFDSKTFVETLMTQRNNALNDVVQLKATAAQAAIDAEARMAIVIEWLKQAQAATPTK